MPFDLNEVTFDELDDEEEQSGNPTDIDKQEEEESVDEVEVQDEENIDKSDELEFSGNDIDDAFNEGEEDNDEKESSNEDSEASDKHEDNEDNEDNEEKGKDSEEEEEGGQEEARVVDEIASQFGLDPEEDFDNELDDTFDDVIKAAKKGAQTMAEQEMNNFFEQYPDIEQYTRYRVNGGDPQTFREEVLNSPSYDELELEGNESTQERVVRQKLQEVDGFSDEKVDQKVDNYKSAGILKSEAEDAKDIMSNQQEQKRQQLIEQQEKEAERRRQEQLEEQKKYRQTIRESNNLGAFQLPENQKDEFESYLFEPVDEETGMTQAEKDYQNMSKEQELTLYYLVYNGLDSLEDMVDNKASTKKAERISDKLKKTSSRSVKDKSETSGRSNDSGSLEGFDLDQQIG